MVYAGRRARPLALRVCSSATLRVCYTFCMPGLGVGTCSWKYPSWKGLVYSRAAGINYLAEYAQKYDSVEGKKERPRRAVNNHDEGSAPLPIWGKGLEKED